MRLALPVLPALTALPLALALAAGLAVPAVAAEPVARGVDDSCPDDGPGEDGFFDIAPADAHEGAVDCLAWWGLTTGVSLGRYAPAGTVTRGQLASFAARYVERAGGSLPTAPPDAFRDDDGSVHEPAINRLAAAGIVAGTGPGTFAPGRAVTRGQLATLLAEAAGRVTGAPLPATQDFFADDAGSVHERGVNRIAQAGFTAGRPDGTYGPDAPLTRAQLGSFLTRALDLAVENGLTQPPPSAQAPVFPAEAQVEHGDVVWGVYTLAAVDPSPAEVEAATAPLRAAGYDRRFAGDLGCDQGAAEALGLDPGTSASGVAVYFDDVAAVEQFLRAYYPERVIGVARVTLYCLD